MAPAPIPCVEGLRVEAVEALHPGGEVFLGRFEDEVKVVAHQAEGMTAPVEAPDD